MIYNLIGRIVVRLGFSVLRREFRANRAKVGAVGVVVLVIVAGLAARSSDA